MRFTIGVNYWPGSSATAMWQRFDAGEIRSDFAHIAALGLDAVRCFVRWDLFQPARDRIDASMLDRLALLVTLAHQAGLRVMPVLFCGHFSGVNYVPDWALDRNAPRGPYRTFCGERESPFGAGNIYRGPLLDAQIVLARAAGERLLDHPAIFAWDIGHEFSRLRRPSARKVSLGEHSQAPADEAIVAEWGRRLTETLRQSSAAPVTAGTSAGDLSEDRDVRLGSLCAPFGFASMQGDGVSNAFARGRLDPEALPFLAMLSAGFSFKPVMVTGVGNPACPAGKFSAFERIALPGEPPNMTISPDDSAFATYPCLTDDENAFYCAQVLERLHADGRLGVFWWSWSDVADELRTPPFDVPHTRRFGLVRSDGSERPAAAALAAFAAVPREVAPTDDMPAIASAYYFRTLPTSARTLYEAYLRFVEDRRSRAHQAG